VIVRRYEAVTGNVVILAETGEKFEILAARRVRERDELPSASASGVLLGETGDRQESSEII
jgi:hypothetical protein